MMFIVWFLVYWVVGAVVIVSIDDEDQHIVKWMEEFPFHFAGTGLGIPLLFWPLIACLYLYENR